MELLAILIALGLFGLWGSGGPVQRDGWFVALHRGLAGWLGGGVLRVTAVILPSLAVGLLHLWVRDALYGLASLLLLVVVLLYAFGRGNLGVATADYLERWSRGDFQAAYQLLRATGDAPGDAEPVAVPRELHALARSRYYYAAFERRFAVLFWFLVLGPAGAMAYRLAALESAQARPTDTPATGLALVHWLDWLPVRLLGISYALVGDFDAGLDRWRTLLDDTRTPAAAVLEACGNAAQRLGADAPPDEPVESLIARGAAELESIEVLHRRALLVWMVVIALLVMAG